MKAKAIKSLLQQKSIFFISVFSLMIPPMILSVTEPLFFTSRIASLLVPLGAYAFMLSIFRKPGYMTTALFPIMLLNAFQLVLLWLFGGSVVAPDMYTNMVISNSSEAGELLKNLWLPVLLVSLIYFSVLALGTYSFRIPGIPYTWRRKAVLSSLLIFLTGLAFAGISKARNPEYSLKYNVFPANAIHNLDYAVQKWRQNKNHAQLSSKFSFQAVKTNHADAREIYMLVLGEASRACNWNLFGYERKTNPLLKNHEGLFLFSDVMTESNTTFKSIPIILSGVNASRYEDLYKQKSIVTAFKEAGFKTLFVSNQAPNKTITDAFSHEADENLNFTKTSEKSGILKHLPDAQMFPEIRRFLNSEQGDLFIVVHTYGSHFDYKERYPKAYAVFQPDSAIVAGPNDRAVLINAYDNSIVYTDFVIHSLMDMLKETGSASALMYISDHGEDLLDDKRQLLLHSSPHPTYYQLHVPMLLWFSESFQQNFQNKVKEAARHKETPVTSSVVFHSLLDIASIRTPFADSSLSVVSPALSIQKRMYLNDYDQAIDFIEAGLKAEDIEMLKKQHIYFKENQDKEALQ
jgi:glucan phosphoethanolaminetransferase (alkaline phosphatase superfamily)